MTRATGARQVSCLAYVPCIRDATSRAGLEKVPYKRIKKHNWCARATGRGQVSCLVYVP